MKTTTPEYIVEFYPHGYALKPAPGRKGIPSDAHKTVSEAFCKDSEGKDPWQVDSGINARLGGGLVIGRKEELEAWRDEIEAEVLATESHPGIRWVKGTRTGTSSLTIFTALIGQETGIFSRASDLALKHPWAESVPSTPLYAGDFWRCQYLLSQFPEWEAQLAKVGEKFPKSAWSRIAPAWPRLKALYLEKKYGKLNAELDKLNRTEKP